VAVDAELSRDFPWLKVDPEPILGDSRPRTLKELWEKSPLWKTMYRDWLAAHNPSYVEGLNSISTIEVRLKEYTDRFERAYPEFYKAAGELKDAVRKNEAAARQRFPWAPPNARAMLGDARPKDFEALTAHGHDGSWVTAFQGWLRAHPPFGDADAWFDWVLMRGGGEAWEKELSAGFEQCVKEVGRLKDELRKREGAAGTARRMARQAGEHIGEAKAKFDERVEHIANKEVSFGVVDDVAGSFSAGVRAGSRQHQQQQHGNQPQQGNQPRQQGTGQQPGQQRPGQQRPGQQRPGQQRTGQQPGQQHGTQQRPTAKKAPPVPPRSEVPRHVQQQVRLAFPLLDNAPNYVSQVDYVAGRFAGFGGELASVAESLRAYKGMVEADAAYVGQQVQTVAAHFTGSDDAALFALLSTMRAAVYRLAWNVDLGFQSYYGGWPHQHLWRVAQNIDSSGSAHLRFAGGRAIYVLTNDLLRLYDGAAALLDITKKVIDHQVPGYQIDDGAVPWGTHQVVLAKDEMSGLSGLTAAWASDPPGDHDDPNATQPDEETMRAFGMAYQDLLQVG